jgi:hypothetical protein
MSLSLIHAVTSSKGVLDRSTWVVSAMSIHVMPSLDEKPNKAKNYCTSSRRDRDRDRDRGHTIRECNAYGNTGVDERQKQWAGWKEPQCM